MTSLFSLTAIFGSVAGVAQTQSSDTNTALRNCATIGLAFSNSAVLVEQNVETMRTRGNIASASDILSRMQAQATELRGTSKALESRYGKATTAEQIAKAKALSEKRLQPMRDAAAVCLR